MVVSRLCAGNQTSPLEERHVIFSTVPSPAQEYFFYPRVSAVGSSESDSYKVLPEVATEAQQLTSTQQSLNASKHTEP